MTDFLVGRGALGGRLVRGRSKAVLAAFLRVAKCLIGLIDLAHARLEGLVLFLTSGLDIGVVLAHEASIGGLNDFLFGVRVNLKDAVVVRHFLVGGPSYFTATPPNGLEMSRPASSSTLHQLVSPQLAGSALSSC
jgi:hypothetical protein